MNTAELDRLIDQKNVEDFFEEMKTNPIMETLIHPDTDTTDKESLQKKQTPMSPEKVEKIRNEVKQLMQKGKKHRWIRRYIKRKYNISEY